MTDEITSFLQKVVDGTGLSFPVATFEKLCRLCIESGPIDVLTATQLGKLTYADEICSSDGGAFAIIKLLETLNDPRWGYVLGEIACNKIPADRLIACLQQGVSTSALKSVALFCTRMKDSYGHLFASVFIGTLTRPKSWDTNGLMLILSVLDTTDKEVLPYLELYKQKIDSAERVNTDQAKKQFTALGIMVRDTMWRIEGRKKMWWQFWKS